MADEFELILDTDEEVEARLELDLIPGPEGGYYKPAVDAEGNIDFTPSKDTMPQVPGGNIRGPQGLSAYDLAKAAGYTGTEEEFAAEQAGFAENAAAVAAAVERTEASVATAVESAVVAQGAAERAEAAKESIVFDENAIKGYVTEAQSSAREAKASEEAAVRSADSAASAQKAAEKARDEAQSIVGGDYMDKPVYDPQGKAQDIFKYIDDAVGNIPTPDVSGQIRTHNTDPAAHSDIRAAMPTILVKNW